jgi:hypothetical protein
LLPGDLGVCGIVCETAASALERLTNTTCGSLLHVQKWDHDEEAAKENPEPDARLGSYDGRLGVRHFKYRTRDGDLFVKIMGMPCTCFLMYHTMMLTSQNIKTWNL